MSKKISICYAPKEVEIFLAQHKDAKFVLYLAHKDSDGWRKSTSRVYMNQISPHLIYLPVDIERNDLESLRQVYKISQENNQIVAINQTQPHKSNPVVQELFRYFPNVPANIDSIIKNQNGELVPFNLNGPAFVDWFADEVTSIAGKTIVLVGVGGAGESIAREMARNHPLELLLIDSVDKRLLAEELSSKDIRVEYASKLSISSLADKSSLIVINAAGKEGTSDDSAVVSLLSSYANKQYIFVDLRPQLILPIVEQAKKLGWKAYTGYGMNARNDYVFLCKVTKIATIEPPSFESFREMVAKAS
jgi:shikimate 5-dehydrogenase